MLTRILIVLSRHTFCAGLLLAIQLPASLVSASVQTYGFTRITSNAAENVAAQLHVDVWDAAQANSTDFIDFYAALSPTISVGATDIGSADVLFVFRNSLDVAAASICDIYFDDGTLLDLAGIFELTSGVNFDQPATPPDLPGGDSIDPKFEVTDPDGPGKDGPLPAFSVDSDNPPVAEGIDSNLELLGISFTLQSDQEWSDVIAALNAGALLEAGDNPEGTLRIGLHVQGIGANSQSDGFINGPPLPPSGGPPSVPEPASVAIWSLLVGLAAFLSSRQQ